MKHNTIEVPTPPASPKEETPTPPKPAKKRRRWILPVILGGVAAFLLAVAAVIAFFFLRPSDLPFKPDTSLIPVYDGKKWGYIDKKGQYVINPQFSDADWFSDGLARVENKDGKYGFIDKKGTYKIPAKYVDATIFNDGLAIVVEECAHPVCINKDGEQVFECTTADGVFCFNEGLAAFYSINDKGERKYGYYDKKGNVVINPQFKYAGTFLDGLAVVSNDEDKYGFIDKKGKYVINPQFDRCFPFFDGLAAFKSGDKWGFIDKEGKYVINPQFDDVDNFYNGVAVVYQGEKCGYIDKKGQFVINPQFEICSGFTYGDGLAYFETDDDKCGYIDKNGKYVINPQFDNAREFCNGIAFVSSNDKWGIIDKKGQYIVNPQFESIKSPYLEIGSCVESEYYDASKFLSSFLKNFSSTKVDGLPTDHVTLEDITNHDVYGEDWEDNLYYSSLTNRLNKEFTNDITLKEVYFSFLSETYEYKYGYYSYDKIYDYSATCGLMIFEFSFENKAEDRFKSICSALCSKLKSIYGGKLFNINKEHDYVFMKKLECGGNLNFIINGEYGECLLGVFFDEDTFEESVKALTEEIASENTDYEYDDEPVTEEAVEIADDDWDL